MRVRISVNIDNEDVQKVYTNLGMTDSNLEYYEN